MSPLNQEEKTHYLAEPAPEKTRQEFPAFWRTVIFIAEIIFVIGLFVWWFSSPSARLSRSLLVLFLYCFPAEFIIAAVPHEPLILYFAKFYSPFIVALVSAAGTVMAEIINYTSFNYVADLRSFKKMREGKFIKKTVALFYRAPFLALLVAGFSPIPFYPFRFLVVLARYPLKKYLLAVFLSRTPRFFFLALFGKLLRIPDSLIALLFLFLILAGLFPPLLHRLSQNKRKKS
ncbi:MAG: VTT domain-containing protein [Candidatus Aminicenantes bacterium]|nr:VTT domain-containing protein [Candidatus Aminicenantes bacterium]